MQYYIIINPFTNKPIQFSTLKDEKFLVKEVISSNLSGPPFIQTGYGICLEVADFDQALLEKTYNPETGLLE